MSTSYTLFRVIPNNQRIPMDVGGFVLHEQNWNDWYKFETSYLLYFIEPNTSQLKSLGGLKIGEKGMVGGRTRIPHNFDVLPPEFFSLGVDDFYYDNLNKLGRDFASVVLESLRDLAYSPELYENWKFEYVLGESLMRSITEETVVKHFRRVAKGGARQTPYRFKYIGPDFSLTFNSIPESLPPSNIHVLIGSNGAGKTTLLKHMTKNLLEDAGQFEFQRVGVHDPSRFAGIVLTSFSAFDPYVEFISKSGESPKFSYLGAHKIISDNQQVVTKNSDDYNHEFAGSFAKVISDKEPRERLLDALKILSSDQQLNDRFIAPVVEAMSIVSIDVLNETSLKIFAELSSGHKIILLLMTKLVEIVEEGTLILLDEPEAHLHPPFLSAFIRALSEFLKYKNGVAIIATHSPVVLQEVSTNCVWLVRRENEMTKFERLNVETFGENVGILTHEVFGLEVTKSGFYNLIAKEIASKKILRIVLRAFDERLGSEGRAVARTLMDDLSDESETN